MKTITEYVRKKRITMMVKHVDSNPNMKDFRNANHYKVTLEYGRKTLTTYFSQGYGILNEPTAEDVLNCLADDAAGFENTRSFEDWASEYGYDTDSRKPERTYKVIERQAKRLQNFLGDDYDDVLWNIERI